MATIVEVDGASSEGESCDQQSAYLASSALTGTEAELYDSGTSRHMSPFQHRFTNLCSIPPRPITAANNRVFYATGMGDLQIDVPNSSESTHITLRDALYTPEMTLTVISISKIASAGYSVIFKGKICYRPLDPGTSPPRSTGISVMRTTRWSWMTRSSGKIGLVLFVYASPDVDGLHESPCDSALMYVTRSPVSSCSVPCAPYPVPCTL
jgi:hypothetical protein